MKYLETDDLKRIQLYILSEIDEICRKNGIRYSLCAGTLLGAVRHKGFIPWDDDIDIMLPRPDFMKLIEYCQSNPTSFHMISCETNSKYADFVAKAYDPNTYINENSYSAKNNNIGVWVDVFSVDGIGNTKEEAVKNFKSTSFLRSLLIARNWARFEKSTTRSWYMEPVRFAFFLVSRFTSPKVIMRAIKKKYRKLTFETQTYSGCLYGAYREREILSKDVFTNCVEMDFENSKYYCIEKYDEYLSSLYGDYMELPPEEKRHTHHCFKAWYKNNDDIGQ